MDHYELLVAKLREVFQIDRPELDFGIYRIMGARRAEIDAYLGIRLRASIEEALGSKARASIEAWQAELTKAERQAAELGIDLGGVEKVRLLREQVANAGAGLANDANAVFSHLLTFFGRYYDSGDFISQRRYKGDTYAIP